MACAAGRRFLYLLPMRELFTWRVKHPHQHASVFALYVTKSAFFNLLRSFLPAPKRGTNYAK